LSQLSIRLQAAEQELINAKLDEKLGIINAARIAQVSDPRTDEFRAIYRFVAYINVRLIYFPLSTTSQAQLIKTYEDDVKSLTDDVKNIEAIRRALPTGCWKKTNIEELR